MLKEGGKIKLILGPMFSGKTTRLVNIVRKYKYKNKLTVLANYALDTRFTDEEGGKIVTHEQEQFDAISCMKLHDSIEEFIQYDVIGIDEGQFFPDLVETCDYLCTNGKLVIVAALSGNFKMEPFDNVSKLISKADKIKLLSAYCFFCQKIAGFTLRTVQSTEEILIGSGEAYKPLEEAFERTEKKKVFDEKLLNDFPRNLAAETKIEFRVDDYDDTCEEFSKIEKVTTLAYSPWKITLLVILNIITCFFITLFIVWYPKLKLKFIYSQVPLVKAKFIGIYGADRKFYIIPIENYKLPDLTFSHLLKHCTTNIQERDIKIFEFKLFKYVYDTLTSSFHSIKFDIKTTQENIHRNFLQGLTNDEVYYQKLIFGDCDLTIQIKSFFQLLLAEVTDPFYIFQLFSFLLWMFNNYKAYAIIIILTTIISLLVSVWETRENLLNVQQMAKYSCPVEIFRRNMQNEKIGSVMPSTELVPGDVFEIPEDGLALPCDAILINGTVIINEAMLTGESTPIIKNHMPNLNLNFDVKNDKKHMIYAGTRIVQKRAYAGGKVMGLVYSTGFNTVKGNLIRSILFPKESDFKFQKDSVTYIFIMALLSFIGFGISLPFLILHGIEPLYIFFKALDLITTTVPPSLPACIGIGISYALSRLKTWGVFCINRERVNVSGKVNMICFDKTGTLTEDHLDIHGFRPVKLNKDKFQFDFFLPNCEDYTELGYRHYKEKIKNNITDKNKDLTCLFVECLASCHGITKVNGKMIGDPIDVKMFEASGWTLNENLENMENYDSLISTCIRPPQEKDLQLKISENQLEDEDEIMRSHYELGIVRRFDFSSKLQRMSTLVKNVNENHYKAFCKGSPEKIKELCRPDTIPDNFNDLLAKYTSNGFRVLALAAKLVKMDYLQSQKVAREVIESHMVFLGLLIVQNKLKEQTAPSLEILHKANLQMVMATGDNILTAISVSKECKLINPDATVYSCEVLKEKGENNLVWNIVESYTEEEEEKDKEVNHKSFQDHHMNESEENLSVSSGRGFTQRFPPETVISLEEYLIKDKAVKNIKETEEKQETNPEDEEEVLNIDVENSPFRDSFEEEYVIAITGSTFETLWKLRNKYTLTKNEKYKSHFDTFRFILKNGYIFARMSPEHKTILVECLREEQFTVCMCGDGANDCGALRAADVGMSLSAEEASIAAHFSSRIPDISCLIKLLREGKASLVTSIQTFKYMMIYSLIQFIAVTMLLLVNSYLTDYQFLASDLIIIFPLAFLIARTGAYHKLTHHQPTGALISAPIVGSIIIQTLLSFAFQFGGWYLLTYMSWYNNYCQTEENTVYSCYDNTVIFLISNMQYLIAAVALSISKPFRKPIYSNIPLMIFIVLAFGYSVYIIVYPDVYSADLLKLATFPERLITYIVLGITGANFLVSYLVEKLIIPCLTKRWTKYKCKKLHENIVLLNQSYNLNQMQKIKNAMKKKVKK